MEQIAEVPENSQPDSRKRLRHPARPDVPSSATPALAARLPRVPFCECLNQPTSSFPPARRSHFVPRPRHGFCPSCSPASSAQATASVSSCAGSQTAPASRRAAIGDGRPWETSPVQGCPTPRPGPLPPDLVPREGGCVGGSGSPPTRDRIPQVGDEGC